MIYQNLEFHNVVELRKRENIPGLQLQRIPVEIHPHLSERGRWNAAIANGAEIRCVTESENLRLFISSLQGESRLIVFQGDFFHSSHEIVLGKAHSIHVSPDQKMKSINPEMLSGRRFAPNVWRFFISGFFPVFHELETFEHEIRPPEANEKPKVRWLAYGSSITAGSGATSGHLSYIQQTAWRLGVDVCNMGQGGACMCEPRLADFFAERGDWDFATLEIGVNMLGTYTTREFEERATYLIRAILEKNPGKPVVVITPYPNSHHYVREKTEISKRQKEYTEFLRKFVETSHNEKLHIIDGFDILTDFSGLTIDMVHPFDTGMIQMGENMARNLKTLLRDLLDE